MAELAQAFFGLQACTKLAYLAFFGSTSLLLAADKRKRDRVEAAASLARLNVGDELTVLSKQTYTARHTTAHPEHVIHGRASLDCCQFDCKP